MISRSIGNIESTGKDCFWRETFPGCFMTLVWLKGCWDQEKRSCEQWTLVDWLLWYSFYASSWCLGQNLLIFYVFLLVRWLQGCYFKWELPGNKGICIIFFIFFRWRLFYLFLSFCSTDRWTTRRAFVVHLPLLWFFRLRNRLNLNKWLSNAWRNSLVCLLKYWALSYHGLIYRGRCRALGEGITLITLWVRKLRAWEWLLVTVTFWWVLCFLFRVYGLVMLLKVDGGGH